ncbi:MAG: penicillin acylase family protein [Fimbriimonas sp.]
MLPLLLAFAPAPPAIERDAYGVPLIRAASAPEAFFQAGYAVAEDRLWQMEMSRRVAQGRMAEVTGARDAASDAEVRQLGYTSAELQAQLDKLSPFSRMGFREYARGVNAYIDSIRNDLPEEYRQAELVPEPWTETDSAAIAVRLMQQFGRGGAGELRNLALIEYLRARPQTKDRVLDVVDDLAWFDPGESPATVGGPATFRDFPKPDPATSARHLASLPRMSLLELVPALRIASREASTRVAERVGAPYKTGSYAVVVGASRSATGRPILLSAPQMGFRTPSIVHEIAMDAPEFKVAGIGIPGVPGVVIGMTSDLAWGLTSGIADTDDIRLSPPGALPTEERKSTVIVKGGPSREVSVRRTRLGPVVLQTMNGTQFVRESSYWTRELESVDALANLWRAKTAAEADAAISRATMSFNFFFATRGGEIGYRYGGLVPVRPGDLDPRLPTLPGAKSAWRRFMRPEEMPHVLNPRDGLLTNWNNRPSTGWLNSDTPVFGRLHRVAALKAALPKGLLTAQDVERAAWTIARTDPFWPAFRPHVLRALPRLTPAAREAIAGFDGSMTAGSRQAGTYARFLDNLRRELFLPITGDLLSFENLRTITQPTALLNALEGRTKVDYRRGRTITEVVVAAMEPAAQGEPYHPGTIAVPGEAPIPYSERGTFIQIVEMLASGPYGRSILPPGNAERGPHRLDQAPLARAWTFKPMHRLP